MRRGYEVVDGVQSSVPRALKFIMKVEDPHEHELDMKYTKPEVNALDRCYLTEERKQKWGQDENHIIQMYDYSYNCFYQTRRGITVDTVVLVLEEVDHGELFDILYYCDRTRPLSEPCARSLFQSMAEGVYYMSQMRVCHRSLRLQDMLLTSTFDIKICDFGMSKVLDSADHRMSTDHVGTEGFQPPQLLRHEQYTIKSDVFSLGVILYTMCAGRPPFMGANKRDTWWRMLQARNYDTFWHANHDLSFSDDLQDLIQGMLEDKEQDGWERSKLLVGADPRQRIPRPTEAGERNGQVEGSWVWYKGRLSIWDILCHPWLQGHQLTERERADYMRKRYIHADKEKNRDQRAKDRMATKWRPSGR